MGDVHEVMPSSTKNMSTLIPLSGNCSGLDDPVFFFAAKSNSAYELKVNFACILNFTTTKLVGINIVVTYQISPKAGSKVLDFLISSITGTPAFVEAGPYKIEYQELAEFMVGETINLANNGKVIGSGYKIPSRKFPGIWVKQNYLFLYDSSAKPGGLLTQ
jgi:hypothetical protein